MYYFCGTFRPEPLWHNGKNMFGFFSLFFIITLFQLFILTRWIQCSTKYGLVIFWSLFVCLWSRCVEEDNTRFCELKWYRNNGLIRQSFWSLQNGFNSNTWYLRKAMYRQKIRPHLRGQSCIWIAFSGDFRSSHLLDVAIGWN